MLHGKVQEQHLNTGRAVEFQCDKGYDLVGDPVVVCMSGNTWSSAFPVCKREKLQVHADTKLEFLHLFHNKTVKRGQSGLAQTELLGFFYI